MKNIILILFLVPLISFSQKIIEMEQKNGVNYISCMINNIPMKFIFDTGASNVTISKTEALFLIKQGQLSKNDIIGKTEYQIANGNIEEGTKIILREITIDGIVLKDIIATVIDNDSSPLLFGQSAIKMLGIYTIQGNKLILKDFPSETEKAEYTIIDLRKETIKFYNNIFNIIYKDDNLKMIARIEDNDLNIILFFKDKIDDSGWSNNDKKISQQTINSMKYLAYSTLKNLICDTDEKRDLFKLNNFTKIYFTMQTMAITNGYETKIYMEMKDYNNLGKYFTELELARILKQII